MAAVARINGDITVEDASGLHVDEGFRVGFTPGAGTYGTRQTVSCTGSAFTALSPPSGAKLLYIPSVTAPSLTLKGITGDTGIPISPASSVAGLPLILPLGTSPSIGIYNGGSTVSVDVLWL